MNNKQCWNYIYSEIKHFSKNSAHNEYRDIVFKINNIHSKVPALEKILFLDNI